MTGRVEHHNPPHLDYQLGRVFVAAFLIPIDDGTAVISGYCTSGLGYSTNVIDEISKNFGRPVGQRHHEHHHLTQRV